MGKQLGLPYMGSKRKLAKKIVDEILNANPNTKYFFDLFGGGAAISFEALQRPKIEKVFYNELNQGVAELLKKIQKDGFTKEFYQWIDRETFNRHKSDDDWFGGLCKVVWSFGNNQKDYLFGKDVEPIKKLAHEVVVFKNEKSNKLLSDTLGIELPKEIMSDNITKNRHLLQRIVKKASGDRFELHQLQQLQQVEQLQRLQKVERIQQVEQLQRLDQLDISSMSYNEVPITTPVDQTIIYLDPPYEGTKEYQKNRFDHHKLEEWITSSPYKIYVSSYDFNLPKVASFKHRSSLSATANNEVTENLYCNQEHKDTTRLF